MIRSGFNPWKGLMQMLDYTAYLFDDLHMYSQCLLESVYLNLFHD